MCVSFVSQQQGVVGYFEFDSSPQPAGYLVFLISALMALKRGTDIKINLHTHHTNAELQHCHVTLCLLIGADHQGAVRFAVVTNQAVAEGVSLTEDESVYLHRRLNSSLVRCAHSFRRYGQILR